MKLLVVEDSKPVSERLRSTLSAFGDLEIEVAHSLREGIARFQELLPDIVLLDIQLPDGSGIDLLELIKQQRAATRVLVFTNHLHYRKPCMAKGTDYFFDKSMELEPMVEIVRTLASVRP